jgi:hypothetical protein
LIELPNFLLIFWFRRRRRPQCKFPVLALHRDFSPAVFGHSLVASHYACISKRRIDDRSIGPIKPTHVLIGYARHTDRRRRQRHTTICLFLEQLVGTYVCAPNIQIPDSVTYSRTLFTAKTRARELHAAPAVCRSHATNPCTLDTRIPAVWIPFPFFFPHKVA